MMHFNYAAAPFVAAVVLLTSPALAQADNFDRARHWMAKRFRQAPDVSFRPSMRRHRPPANVAVHPGSMWGPHSRPVLVRVARRNPAKSAPLLRMSGTRPQRIVVIERIYVVHAPLLMH
jgi:hypothetical protein